MNRWIAMTSHPHPPNEHTHTPNRSIVFDDPTMAGCRFSILEKLARFRLWTPPGKLRKIVRIVAKIWVCKCYLLRKRFGVCSVLLFFVLPMQIWCESCTCFRSVRSVLSVFYIWILLHNLDCAMFTDMHLFTNEIIFSENFASLSKFEEFRFNNIRMKLFMLCFFLSWNMADVRREFANMPFSHIDDSLPFHESLNFWTQILLSFVRYAAWSMDSIIRPGRGISVPL